jgi:tetratricopeptide (TPR) repeat protein
VKLADYYHARGYAARKQGNFAGAVEEYSRALSLTPSHFKALFNRGFSYDKVCLACCRQLQPTASYSSRVGHKKP